MDDPRVSDDLVKGALHVKIKAAPHVLAVVCQLHFQKGKYLMAVKGSTTLRMIEQRYLLLAKHNDLCPVLLRLA